MTFPAGTVLHATRSAVYLMDLSARFTVRGFPDDGGATLGGTVTIIGVTTWGSSNLPAYRVRLGSVWAYADDGALIEQASPVAEDVVLVDAVNADWTGDFVPAGVPEPSWFTKMRARNAKKAAKKATR